MSGYRRYRRPPRQSTKALTVKLALLAVVATLVIGALIAAQMAAGNDPALGPKAVARAKKASTRTSSGSSSTAGSSGSSSGYGYSTQQPSPAPVTSSTS
jgi:hypothetical protein